MVPLPIVDFPVDRPGLGGAGAHVQQQVEVPVQHLNGKEVHLEDLRALGVLHLLGLAVAKEEQAVGLGGAEVEGDGAGLFGVPLAEGDVGLRRLEGDGVQGGDILALEGHHPVHLHLHVSLLSQPGQLQPHIIVLIHNLFFVF